MTGRERILAVFRHEVPDRVPCFEQSVASTAASAVLGREAFTGGVELHYQEICSWDGGEEGHERFVERMHRDLFDLVREMRFDAVRLPWRFTGRPLSRLDEFTFLFGKEGDDDFQVVRYYPESRQVGEVDSALRREGLDLIRRHVERMEKAWAEQEKEGGRGRVERNQWLQRAMEEFGGELAITGGHSLAVPMSEHWLMATALEPDLVDRYLEVQFQRGLRAMAEQKEAGVDVILGGGDLADNTGPVYSPQFFRDHLLERYRKTIELCNELGLYYVFRSDGVLWPLAEMLWKEAGVHGYGEIDKIAGMEIDVVKERYPHVVCWGGVDCGGALERGSVEETIEAARDALRKGMPGAHYIFGSSNSILYDTPPENFRAMYRTAQEEGWYK